MPAPASSPAEPRARQGAPAQGPFARVVERNITALLQRRKADDARRGRQDRVADAITRFTGSMTFVYIHLVVYATWVVTNLVKHFDPGFTVLAMEASVEAIFLSTFVLISQNRMQALSDKRADLDLQVSLLSEHEVTELIRMVRAMARQMNVEEARDPELDELATDVQPETVMSHIEAAEQRLRAH